MAKNEKNEVKEEKVVDPKAAAKKQARMEAKARIVNFLKDNAEQLGGLKADIELFIGKGQRAAKAAVKSVNAELRDAFLSHKTLSELDIFKQFRIGRPEMVTKMRILVLCPNPDDRVWVKFDEPTETYSVVGTGATPPEGWDGYVPSSKVANL